MENLPVTITVQAAAIDPFSKTDHRTEEGSYMSWIFTLIIMMAKILLQLYTW